MLLADIFQNGERHAFEMARLLNQESTRQDHIAALQQTIDHLAAHIKEMQSETGQRSVEVTESLSRVHVQFSEIHNRMDVITQGTWLEVHLNKSTELQAELAKMQEVCLHS